jgi:signal transduction histidine kinase
MTGDTSKVPSPATRLCVISDDAKVLTLCRDVLRDLSDTLGDWQILSSSREVPTWDVCLLDYEPGRSHTVKQFGDQKIFYLVRPTQLESLRAEMPAAEGNILLKPVSRAVLRAFLGSVAPPKPVAPVKPGATETPSPNGPSATASEVGALRANRDEMLQCLLHANLRLQEYDQQRTNFIARAVHDFRAPLTALSGFCGLLVDGELGPLNKRQEEALQRMQHSTRRISRMASAMFDLSISQQVSHKPDLREANIREHIKQALHEIMPVAREKRITLTAENTIEPGSPLCFDPLQIEQVLLNLLDNASKFTPKGGCIEVIGYPYFWERRFMRGRVPVERRMERARALNSYRVDIKDSGPGVPPEHLDRIFEEYTSYSGPHDRSGGGLGLAICRLIIGRHQGHIWAESREDGGLFSFVLPYQQRRQTQGNVPSPPEA